MSEGQIPYSATAEEAVIGSVIIDPGAYTLLDLEPDDFFVQRNRWIWEAFGKIVAKSHTPDFISITNELEASGTLAEVGGPAYITSLITKVPSSLRVEEYAQIVAEKARRRNAIGLAQELAVAAYDEDVDMDQASAGIVDRLTSGIRTKHPMVPINDVMTQTIDYVQDKMNDPADTWGVPTGFTDLDRMTGGVAGIWLLAGEPGIGKSIFMLQTAVQAAMEFKKRVAIFSLEMSNLSQGLRMLSAGAEIDTRALKTGKIDGAGYSTLFATAEIIAELPIYICDEPNLNTTQLRAHIARLKAQGGLDLFALDYLYLMTDEEKLEPTDRTEILSKRVKAIGRQFDVAGITVNSVTKEGMGTTKARSKNLRGSGQLIHDADLIIFIRKHDYEPSIRVLEITKGRELDMTDQGTVELYKTNTYPSFKSAMTRQIDFSEELP